MPQPRKKAQRGRGAHGVNAARTISGRPQPQRSPPFCPRRCLGGKALDDSPQQGPQGRSIPPTAIRLMHSVLRGWLFRSRRTADCELRGLARDYACGTLIACWIHTPYRLTFTSACHSRAPMPRQCWVVRCQARMRTICSALRIARVPRPNACSGCARRPAPGPSPSCSTARAAEDVRTAVTFPSRSRM